MLSRARADRRVNRPSTSSGNRCSAPYRRMRHDLDRDQRQLVLVPEQRVGAIGNGQPAVHLGAAGQEEDRTDGEPVDRRHRVVRHQAGQPAGQAVPEAAQAGRRAVPLKSVESSGSCRLLVDRWVGTRGHAAKSAGIQQPDHKLRQVGAGIAGQRRASRMRKRVARSAGIEKRTADGIEGGPSHPTGRVSRAPSPVQAISSPLPSASMPRLRCQSV